MLYLIQSNRMEVLSEQLAIALRQPLAGSSLLQPEPILVQSPGMSTWLRLEIAKYNQIAAAIEFPLPSSFTWQLCHDLIGDLPQKNPFTKAVMSWKLMELLPQLLANPEFAPLNHYLKTEVNAANNRSNEQLKLFQLCGQIADIYDQYLVYRPDWIASWEANNDYLPPSDKALPIEQAWQPILWRALLDFNSTKNNAQNYDQNSGQSTKSGYHRANLHQQLLTLLEAPNTDLSQLPKRLFVFGISSMAPQTLAVLYNLAKHIDVTMFSLSPCQHYWGDIIDPKLRARMAVEYADKLQLAPLWEDKLTVGNPLLANNGKMGRELLDLILELPEADTNFNFEYYQDPGVQTLLHGIQHDILELSTRNRSLGPDAELYLTIDDRRLLQIDDDSLTLRSCHSPLREIETLHDHLLEMLTRPQTLDSSTLEAKDIVIMLPDVASYAPYIDAVFSAKQGSHYIPYAIADRGAAQQSPLISSFLKLLAIEQSRFALTDIIAILEVPAVLRRFELNDDELMNIRDWLEQANIRWGRDQQNRSEQAIPAFEVNSWAFGLRRLILGYAFADDAPIYQENLIVQGVEGQSAQALGKLLNFIETLDRVREQLSGLTNIEERLKQLFAMIDAFYDADHDEQQELLTIREAIETLKDELNDAGQTTPLSSQVLQNWFTKHLSQSRVGQKYLAGSVNFCTLMPMRSIPFKVVCLVGMNDGVYPRAQHAIGFDLVAQSSARKGDRSRRLDDRYLFLEAILSAREQLYISYIGNSERDNSERLPSMLVSELIEYCQLCYLPENLKPTGVQSKSQTETAIKEIEREIYKQLVIEQPLQPFDQRLYTPDTNVGQAHIGQTKQSYNPQWCPIFQISNEQMTDSAPPFIDPQTTINNAIAIVNSEPVEVELSSLIRFFKNPAKYFFNRSLKVNLGLSIQTDDNDEPFTLDGLQRYQLQSRLLNDAIEQGLEQPTDSLLAKITASGQLPVAPFDKLLLKQYLRDIKPLIGRSCYLRGSEQRSIDIDIKLNINQEQAPTRLTGRIDDICAKGLVNYRPGSANGNDLIQLYLRHLAINAMAGETNSNFERSNSRESYLLDIGYFHTFVAITSEQARKQLALWLNYFHLGQLHPIIFMPKTSLAYVQAEGEHDEKLQAAQKKWLDTQNQFGEEADPYYQRLYRFPDDFAQDTFGEIATNLLTPMLSLYQTDKLSELTNHIDSITSAESGDTTSLSKEKEPNNKEPKQRLSKEKESKEGKV